MKEESFQGKVEVFPDGWFYVKVPKRSSNPYNALRKNGNVSIGAKINSSEWPTLLWGFGDDTFFITLPARVRKKEKISAGDQIKVQFTLRTK